MAFAGDFTPVLAKHSKSFSLIDCLSVGVDRMQRNFEPMQKQVEASQRSELTDVTTKVVIYEALVEGRLEAPKHLARTVHDLYFEPKYDEFRPRTIWSFSNAFTSAFKDLDPIPQFKAVENTEMGELSGPVVRQNFTLARASSACVNLLIRYSAGVTPSRRLGSRRKRHPRFSNSFAWSRPTCARS
jgi:hypothetical protein